MSNSKLKKGLGKSFGKMFGNNKVRTEYLEGEQDDAKEAEVIDITDKKNDNSSQNQNDETPSVDEEKKEPVNQSSASVNVKPQSTGSVQDEKANGSQTMLKISLIQPNINQPRKNFNEEELQELSESIQKYGVVEPLVVRKNGPLYEIIAGERRWRASKLAGLEKVPVVIKEYDDRTAKEVALIENIQRSDLNPIEEALAYQSLIEEYGLTQEEVARRVSKNRSTVTNALRILNLNKEIQEMLKNGSLTQGHARALLAIDNDELREKIAKRVVEENLSVREIEKLVRLEGLAQFRDNKRKEQNTESMQQLRIIIKDLERQLKHKFNTKVGIIPKNEESGRIEIEYYTKEDLDRLFLLLNGSKEG